MLQGTKECSGAIVQHGGWIDAILNRCTHIGPQYNQIARLAVSTIIDQRLSVGLHTVNDSNTAMHHL